MDSYNPRFRYKDSAAALAGSNKVQASSALLHLAVGVLRSVIGKYGSERFTASPRRIPRLPMGDSVSTPRSSNIPTRELIWDPVPPPCSGYHTAIWGEILSREQADRMVSNYIDQNGMAVSNARLLSINPRWRVPSALLPLDVLLVYTAAF